MDIIRNAIKDGKVESLQRFLDENPAFPLADPKFTCFRRTILHEAVMHDRVDFASVIVNTDPRIVKEVDSQGFTPLHLASAKNNFEMVRVLLNANTDACIVPDNNGGTPLHVAAIKDEVDKVMGLLIEKRPEAIHQRLLNTNETILHLCVKHNQISAMRKVLDYLKTDGGNIANNSNSISVNSVDSGGNTIMHLAAQKKDMEMFEYLVNYDDKHDMRIDISILNKEEVTALDMLNISEMKHIGLCCYKSYDYHHSTKEIPEPEVPQQNPTSSNEWLKERMSAIMVVATLIAAISFQAVINPPGGVFQEDSKISSTEDPVRFIYYLRKVIDNPAMSKGFQSYNLRLHNLPPQMTERGNITAPDEIMTYRANFVNDLLIAAKSSESLTSSLLKYKSQKYLAPGIVLEDDWWMNITSNYNTTYGGGGSGFSPYLMHYAGTAILAYISPKAYESYIILNSLSLISCASTIVVVTFDAIKQRPSGFTVSMVGYLELLLAISVACIGLSYIIVVNTICPPFYMVGTISDSLLRLVIGYSLGPLLILLYFYYYSGLPERDPSHPLSEHLSYILEHIRKSGTGEFIWLMIKMFFFFMASLGLWVSVK